MRHSSRFNRSLAAALTLSIPLVAACGGSQNAGGQDGSIELRFATPNSEAGAGDWKWIAEEVEKRTDGRVKFRNFYSGTLVDAEGTLKAVQDGRADVGWVSPTYQPADFPVWSANQLQFISDNAEAVMRAVHAEYAEGSLLTEDLDDSGVRPLGFLVYGPNVVGTKEPMETLDDLNGLVMRSGGTSDDIMQAAGAAPTTLGTNEMYEAFERGTIDGYTQLPFFLAAVVGLHEITPYITDIGSGAYSSAVYAMNQEVWESLPEDVQEVFQEVSEEFVTEYFVYQNDLDDMACAAYKEAGVEISRLPEDEIAELRDRARGDLVEEWKTTAADAGFDRAEIDEYFESYVGRIRAAEQETTTFKNPFEVCS